MTSGPAPELITGLALINEVGTATQLLAVGLNQITAPDWYAAEPAAAFTCLASGVERVLKLTYGFDLVNRGASFPTDGRFRELGHGLVALQETVTPSLVAAATSGKKAYALRLLTDVSDDPYWLNLLAVLDAWSAATGRYRDLTVLSGGVMTGDPPSALWNDVEGRCAEDLGLLSELTGPGHRDALVRVRSRLALSVLKWWFSIYRAWIHGLVGADRKMTGTALSPTDTRQLDAGLSALAKGLANRSL